ncbi:ferrochelatase [uncultured Phenylobacterium sp.]|uniref:ferrochelatase n=1 Tax=uncultured Phenylobacterium sp. TaxID=349273 RepID=UPI0025E992E1|nr:ferrochelatase [uncultured Phenylobacterium sp.]
MKVAVVLFNLGGPDNQKAVRPFLFNLFRDPAIIQLPAPARYALAALISTTRAKSARANYQRMGGGSPLLAGTNAQARVLEEMLTAQGLEARTFVAMRYWKPFTEEMAAQVARFAPDEIVLLPLYPQYSTTTTGSSLKEWARVYKGPGRTRTVCCYPTAPGLVDAHVEAIRKVWRTPGDPPGEVRLLFSAHGLPQQVVEAGDPYAAQIEATAAAVAARLPEFPDWQLCYQSRVGRLKWLGPSTVEAIHQAAADGKGVLICPIAFVSEHIETLVELDVEYAELAKDLGVQPFLRARTPETDRGFMAELARAVTGALDRDGIAPHGPWRCPAAHGKCVCARGEIAA